MDEHAWTTTFDWIAMWHTLDWDEAAERKRRTIATELCRRFLPHLTDPRLHRLIELSAARAEGGIKEEHQWDEWEDACDEATAAASAAQSAIEVAAAWVVAGLQNDDHKIGRTIEGVPYFFGCLAALNAGILRSESLPEEARELRTYPVFVAGHDEEGPRVIADMIREVVGNPFRPVAFDPDWRTDTVVSLARGMYESRGFGGMPILADALQDAGCDHPDILAHCRGDGPHVRGCWVVDLVLNK
jgi:hypothetical protein